MNPECEEVRPELRRRLRAVEARNVALMHASGTLLTVAALHLRNALQPRPVGVQARNVRRSTQSGGYSSLRNRTSRTLPRRGDADPPHAARQLEDSHLGHFISGPSHAWARFTIER